MARPAKKHKKLNEEKQEVINEEFLAQNPEGYPDELSEPIVVAEMRSFVFVNGRDPGCPLEFHYHSKTHYLKQYKLLHGHEYTLPLEVIEHIESRAIPNYTYRKGEDGHPVMQVSSYNYLYQCRNTRSTQAHRPAA
jgi:hypothetical protein